MSFDSFGLRPEIMASIRAMGYTAPTPIQAKALSPALGGGDLMCLAQTGTGKTAVFIIPILQHLLTRPGRGVRALVIAPTRELAEQTYEFSRALSYSTRIRSVTVYGGVGMTPQVNKLRAGADIVIACPGRLLDHMGQRTIDLSNVEILVLDEADRMLDMGFLPDIRKILQRLPQKRQTMMLSATMPEEIRQLALDILANPAVVQVDHTMPLETVSHAIYPVSSHLKTPLLIELLRRTDSGSVLVFTRTKHRTKRICEQLGRAGFKASSLQGNLSQNRRKEAMDGFKSGKYQILVATDIAARGIDVSSISHVINYDMPDTADAYTHRIGRTGRATKTGDAFTLVTPEDGQMVRIIEQMLDERLERRTLENFDYGRPAPPRSEHHERHERHRSGQSHGGRSHASRGGQRRARPRYRGFYGPGM